MSLIVYGKHKHSCLISSTELHVSQGDDLKHGQVIIDKEHGLIYEFPSTDSDSLHIHPKLTSTITAPCLASQRMIVSADDNNKVVCHGSDAFINLLKEQAQFNIKFIVNYVTFALSLVILCYAIYCMLQKVSVHRGWILALVFLTLTSIFLYETQRLSQTIRDCKETRANPFQGDKLLQTIFVMDLVGLTLFVIYVTIVVSCQTP